jgi:hypothetical protein
MSDSVVVVNSPGTPSNVVVSGTTTGPQGPTGAAGATGATPTISATATTLSVGSTATATVSGSAIAPVITFGIPTGATGAAGATGTSGVISVNGPITNTGSSTVAIIGINDASTSTKGAVQLTDSVTSTSSTTAATPNAVKTAYDLASGKAGVGTVNTFTTGAQTIKTGADDKTALILQRNSATQSANLLSVLQSDGTTEIARMRPNGQLGVGALVSNTVLGLDTTYTGDVRFIGMKQVGSASANAIELLNSGSTILFKVDGTGAVTAPNLTATTLNTAGIVTNNSSGLLGTVTAVPVANGGTGATATTGSGNNVLSSSPALTGTPTVPTAAVDTNSTQAASTAFVLGQSGSAAPLVNGTVATGTSTLYARQDHVHPTDTSRAPASGIAASAITGTAVTQTDFLNTFFGYPSSGYDSAPRFLATQSRTITNGQLYTQSFIPLKDVTGISEITMYCSAGTTDSGPSPNRRMALYQVTAGVGTATPTLTCLGVITSSALLFSATNWATPSTCTNVAGTFNGTNIAAYTCNSMAVPFTVGQWVKVTGGTGATYEGEVSVSAATSFTLVGANTVATGSSTTQTATTVETFGRFTRTMYVPNSSGNSTTKASITLTAGNTYAVGVLGYNTSGYVAPTLVSVGNSPSSTLLPLLIGGKTGETNITSTPVTISGNTSVVPWARLS